MERLATIERPKPQTELVLPPGYQFADKLGDKHIEQLVAYSTDPKDVDVQDNTADNTRFKDRDAVLKWQEKGRSVAIITNDDGDLLGISWLGGDDLSLEDREPKIAFNPSQYGVTFAIRTYEKARGKGLAGALTRRAEELFEQSDEYQKLLQEGRTGRWLEVSADNKYAIRSYRKSNYVQATESSADGKILMIQKAAPSPVTVFQR